MSAFGQALVGQAADCAPINPLTGFLESLGGGVGQVGDGWKRDGIPVEAKAAVPDVFRISGAAPEIMRQLERRSALAPPPLQAGPPILAAPTAPAEQLVREFQEMRLRDAQMASAFARVASAPSAAPKVAPKAALPALAQSDPSQVASLWAREFDAQRAARAPPLPAPMEAAPIAPFAPMYGMGMMSMMPPLMAPMMQQPFFAPPLMAPEAPVEAPAAAKAEKVESGEIQFTQDNKIVSKAPAEKSAEEIAEAKAAAEEEARQAKLEDEAKAWAQEFAKKYGQFSDQERSWWEGRDVAEEPAPAQEKAYAFAEDNKYLKKKNAFKEGVKLFKAGHLAKAILCFEAAVQQEPTNAEAWRYLGQAQAENEDEAHAIAALSKAISIDPYNLPALMMLGVSYTNDLEEGKALKYLKTWILHHPDYQGDALAEHKQQLEEYEQFYGGQAEQRLDHNLHNVVTKMFQRAAIINPKDYEVHTVLGVLYHLSNDYDKAIVEFKEAVRLKPDDPTLWNKLGATQANSNRSADAVHAYRRALQLRPTYVRVLANLAIAFANQNKHEDAVVAYLATLKQNPKAQHVWSYLRISLSNLQRQDLVELTYKQDVNLFRPHFKF
jgi:Flp pilus assembly protein TadD